MEWGWGRVRRQAGGRSPSQSTFVSSPVVGLVLLEPSQYHPFRGWGDNAWGLGTFSLVPLEPFIHEILMNTQRETKDPQYLVLGNDSWVLSCRGKMQSCPQRIVVRVSDYIPFLLLLTGGYYQNWFNSEIYLRCLILSFHFSREKTRAQKGKVSKIT